MGINFWGAAVGSKGYSALATAGTITHNIDGQSGKRIAITAFGATPGEVANPFYFMVPLAHTTASAAAASGATNISLTATPSDYGTSDVVAILLDDGSYQWTTVAASATTNNHLTSALTDTVAAGNDVWYLGVYTDNGHYRFTTTASTQKAVALAEGILYGSYKGGPMRFHFQVTSSGATSVDYITYAYIDK